MGRTGTVTEWIIAGRKGAWATRVLADASNLVKSPLSLLLGGAERFPPFLFRLGSARPSVGALPFQDVAHGAGKRGRAEGLFQQSGADFERTIARELVSVA